MSACVFCKIVSGQIPCIRVYEDDVFLCFLDVGPISPGHTLLIPKRHYETIMEMPPEEVAHLARQLPALAGAVKGAVEAEGINILQNNGRCSGQAVFHVHIHLIPRWPEDGLGFRWPAKEVDPEVLKGQAEAIRERISA